MLSRAVLPLVLAILAGPAAAQQRQAPAPERLGDFDDWTAAIYREGGQKVCYAFTRASRSEPSRQDVILTVTHRAQGRDQVAMRAGYTYPRNAEVTVTVGDTELPFYTARDSAFARDGRQAVASFRAGRDAVARGPAASGRGTVSDTFSLMGFTAAYEAISRECPGGR